MALKTNVIDRVPTYPGRVKMTPVSGQTDTYDLVRADSPVTEGTPINAALLNQKADMLVANTIVHVNGATGSDVIGDGSSGAPYATIQKAVDSVPKCLGGCTATIDIAAGTYAEAVSVVGFYGGWITIGVESNNVTVNSISVLSSSNVEVNIWTIKRTDATAPLFYATADSHVVIKRSMTIDGGGSNVSAILVEQGSKLTSDNYIHVSNVGQNAVEARSGSHVSLTEIKGMDNGYGLCADTGGVITYQKNNMSNTGADRTFSGGRIFNAQKSVFAEVLILYKSGWQGDSAPYTQVVSLADVTENDDPFVDVYLNDVNNSDDYNSIIDAWGCVGRMTTEDGAIRAYCFDQLPATDIPIIVKVVR